MKTESWSLEDLFGLIDKENKGWVGVYDVERLLATHTKVGQRASLISDIELMVGAFNRSGAQGITLCDFKKELTPRS